jgi:SNF2 family DNA or RNA helicase
MAISPSLELLVSQAVSRSRLLERAVHDLGRWIAVAYGSRATGCVELACEVLPRENRVVLTGYIPVPIAGLSVVEVYCDRDLVTCLPVSGASPCRFSLEIGIQSGELAADPAAVPSPWPSIEYQVDGIARAYLRRCMMTVWDTGVGKTHLGLAASCLALEDGEAEVILVVCEKGGGKLYEWESDYRAFTHIEGIALYHGPNRAKKLAKNPTVLISTFETVRQDVARFETALRIRDGALMTWLRGRKVMVIYDEISKLGNRSSRLYKAHQYMLRQLRKLNPGLRVIGLTATPIERNYENAFNEMRLVAPGAMPTVEEFERRYIRSREAMLPSRGEYGRITWNHRLMPEFSRICAPHLLRKRKTDPDVRDQFPPMTEEFVTVEMKDDQRKIYRALEDLAWAEGEYQEVPGLRILLRQFCGHPLAVQLAGRRGGSAFATMVADTLRTQLDDCSSAKTDELLSYVAKVAGDQDYKLLAFTFFGQTVLPVLEKIITTTGIPVYTIHGEMTARAQHESKEAFLAHSGGAVMLSSDAGSRGINIPGVSMIIEYEAALTHAKRIQRFGRGSRVGQGMPLTCVTLCIAGTLESKKIIKANLERAQQADTFLGDDGAEGHISAGDRRLMFAMARRRTS